MTTIILTKGGQGSEQSEDPKGSAFTGIYGEEAPHGGLRCGISLTAYALNKIVNLKDQGGDIHLDLYYFLIFHSGTAPRVYMQLENRSRRGPCDLRIASLFCPTISCMIL